MMSLTDIPLQFNEFQHLNHVEKCTKYTEILQKLDVIQVNDLDALYTDLEILQGASNKRLRRLEDEIKILTEWCDKKERSKNDDIDLSTPTSKRSRTGGKDDSKYSKKQKFDDSSKSAASKLRSKGKVASDSNESESYVSASKPRVSYDAPNKFWSYVEPYCTDITQDDIKVLEDSLTSRVDINEYYKIPPLGRHYSEIWNKEDFIEEHSQSSKIDKKRNGSTPLSNVENVESKFHNIDLSKHQNEDVEQCPYGSFTQRLVAALVDENIMAPMTESELQDVVRVDDDVKIEKNSQLSSNNTNKKAPILNYTKNLENAIKDELFALGLIDSVIDDEHDFDADDEILSELRKCQSELKALRSHNKQSVNKLAARARTAMKKQDARLKAKVLDGEVVDIFRRFTAMKAKKKGFSRKDREMAWKAVREREQLWKMVDNNETSNEKNEKKD